MDNGSGYTMVYRYTSPLRLVAFIGFGIFATSSRPRRTSPPASKSTRPRAFEDGFGWGSHNILYGKNMCSIWLWTYFDKLLSQCFFLLSNKRLFDCSIIQQIPEFDTEVWRLCGSIKLWVDARFWSFQVPHVLSKYRQLLCKSEQHHWHFVSFVINCYCMYSHCRASCGQADVTFSMHIPHFQQDCSIRFCHSPTKPWSYF